MTMTTNGDTMMSFSTMHLPLMVETPMFSTGILRQNDHRIVCRRLVALCDQSVEWVNDRYGNRIMSIHRNSEQIVRTVMVVMIRNRVVVRMALVVIDVASYAYNQQHMLQLPQQLNCIDRNDGHYGLDPCMVNWIVCSWHG